MSHDMTYYVNEGERLLKECNYYDSAQACVKAFLMGVEMKAQMCRALTCLGDALTKQGFTDVGRRCYESSRFERYSTGLENQLRQLSAAIHNAGPTLGPGLGNGASTSAVTALASPAVAELKPIAESSGDGVVIDSGKSIAKRNQRHAKKSAQRRKQEHVRVRGSSKEVLSLADKTVFDAARASIGTEAVLPPVLLKAPIPYIRKALVNDRGKPRAEMHVVAPASPLKFDDAERKIERVDMDDERFWSAIVQCHISSVVATIDSTAEATSEEMKKLFLY